MDHATIRQVLLSAGWRERDITEILCARDLEMPIPRPPAALAASRPRGRRVSVWPRRARDAFLHLLAFAALYTWVTTLILLLFTCIDFALPDPAWRQSQPALVETLSITRGQLAILIVSFPIFLILWHYLLREVSRDPEKARGAIRRWLGYLAISVGALTLAIDVMTLIFLLLEGQMTARLLLKVALLFTIAGSLVGYLALTLRSENRTEAAA